MSWPALALIVACCGFDLPAMLTVASCAFSAELVSSAASKISAAIGARADAPSAELDLSVHRFIFAFCGLERDSSGESGLRCRPQ